MVNSAREAVDAAARYASLWRCLVGQCLIREMSFRANFFLRSVLHIVWFSFNLLFVELLFLQSPRIAGWSRGEYLLLFGTSLAINGVASSLFVPFCGRFSHLVRTGELDLALLRPVNLRFLLTWERCDLAIAPQLALCLVVLTIGAIESGIRVTIAGVAGYALLVGAGIVIAQALLTMLAATAVWTIRSDSFLDLWFGVSELSRYPAEIYRRNTAGRVVEGLLSYVVPMLIAVNTPARFATKAILDPRATATLLAAAIVLHVLGHLVFEGALRRYRSAGG